MIGLIGRLVYWYKVQLHLICILLKQKIGSYFFSSSSQVSVLHVAIFCQNVATFWSRFRPSVIRRLRWSFWWSFFSDLMPDLVYEQHDCQFANLLAKNELTKKLEFQIDFQVSNALKCLFMKLTSRQSRKNMLIFSLKYGTSCSLFYELQNRHLFTLEKGAKFEFSYLVKNH